ncbi:MAG: trimethylamine methyltransferase [Desulfatitalea sp.]|nr:trimethylamine methyltransferase family protein [Desulfatitalea sp.]NNK01955.1 trimethylamine methyltransferase [Desulfatitalea sp.]
MRKGLPGGRYRPLTDSDIERIHHTVMRVFSEVGVQVNHDEALRLFEKAGAKVDTGTRIVKFDPALVMALVKQAPSMISLCGREPDGSLDLQIGGTRVYMGTGGTALNVQDPGADDNRRSQLRDIMNMARLVDVLENIHFYMLNIFPNDVDREDIDVNRFGAALNRTKKHVMGGVYTVEGVRHVIRMAEMIAGSAEALRRRPFISMVACIISPFKLDEEYGRLAIEAAQNNIPLVVPAEPLCGATAPITLAGNLVVDCVDTLTGVMLAQLVNPGTPVLFGCISSITDLRDMKYLAGAVEMGLLNAGASQMAQFYELPIYATAGMSDAKVNDAQAGYESAISSLLVALAGGNFIHDAAGFLEFCMTASFDKLVIDNEIIGMVMRAVEGIRVDDTTLAFDEIQKVGPAGHYVASRHTRRHMRNEQFMPQLSDRETRDVWQAAGGKDARQRATQFALNVLNAEPTACIDADVRRRIVAEIPGIRPFLME